MEQDDIPEKLDNDQFMQAFNKQKENQNNIEDMMEKMQIDIVGGNNEEEKHSDSSFQSDDQSDTDLLDTNFKEDENKIS